jgi:hypothetical protein
VKDYAASVSVFAVKLIYAILDPLAAVQDERSPLLTMLNSFCVSCPVEMYTRLF